MLVHLHSRLGQGPVAVLAHLLQQLLMLLLQALQAVSLLGQLLLGLACLLLVSLPLQPTLP